METSNTIKTCTWNTSRRLRKFHRNRVFRLVMINLSRMFSKSRAKQEELYLGWVNWSSQLTLWSSAGAVWRRINLSRASLKLGVVHKTQCRLISKTPFSIKSMVLNPCLMPITVQVKSKSVKLGRKSKKRIYLTLLLPLKMKFSLNKKKKITYNKKLTQKINEIVIHSYMKMRGNIKACFQGETWVHTLKKILLINQLKLQGISCQKLSSLNKVKSQYRGANRNNQEWW